MKSVSFSRLRYEPDEVSMGTTIRDVAREAGVSPSTVSRVFNDSSLVKKETQQRVREAARRLRYVPNGTARALSIKKTHVLGLILPYPHREFFSEIVRGIDETAQQAGYLLQTSSSHNRLEDTRMLMRATNGRIDGLLLLSPHYGAEDLAEYLPSTIPVVFMLSQVPEDSYDLFAVDNWRGAYDAVRHLTELGHERIGVITGLPGNREAEQRLQGYRQALRDAGIEPDPALELPGAFTQLSGYEATSLMLRKGPRPTALFASNDYMALGALSALQQAGVRVPDDMAIIGFDDILSARYASPALSTMHVPAPELASRATRRLVELIEEPREHANRERATVTLVPALRVRDTTAGGTGPAEAKL